MSAPPQRRPNKAERAQRDTKVFQLKVAGLTERRIAAEVGLSQSRVNKILSAEVAARVGPAAEAYVSMREAELHDLWAKAYRLLATAEDADTKLKALTTALRVNESRRKLRGADAPEALTVGLERRLSDETEVVTTAVLAAMHALSVFGERRQYALEAAAAVLGGEPEPKPLPPETGPCTPYTADGGLYFDGPPGSGLRYRVVATERTPPPTVSRLELEAGPSATRAQQPDGVDAVMDAVREFEAEFGSVFDDDEDGTDGTGADDA